MGTGPLGTQAGQGIATRAVLCCPRRIWRTEEQNEFGIHNQGNQSRDRKIDRSITRAGGNQGGAEGEWYSKADSIRSGQEENGAGSTRKVAKNQSGEIIQT